MTEIFSGFVEGIFVRELKNRFLCEVLIDNTSTECYVPSSCHLSNFLVLRGKRVLLLPTQSPNTRTAYALFAVQYKRNYIVVNTGMANKAIEDCIHSRHFAFLGVRKEVVKEHTIHGYKADLYISDTGTIVEVKSVISLNTSAQFPTVFSERTIKQLQKLYELLKQGHKACFFVVSLHPYVSEVVLDRNTPFYEELSKCIDLGLMVAAFTCRLHGNRLLVEKRIPIQ